jgi:hypothetical protein
MRRDQRRQRLMENAAEKTMESPCKTSIHSRRLLSIFDRSDHGDAKSGGTGNSDCDLSVLELTGIRRSCDMSFTALDGRRMQRLDLHRC